MNPLCKEAATAGLRGGGTGAKRWGPVTAGQSSGARQVRRSQPAPPPRALLGLRCSESTGPPAPAPPRPLAPARRADCQAHLAACSLLGSLWGREGRGQTGGVSLPSVAMARGRPASQGCVERTRDPSAIWVSCVYRSSLPARLRRHRPGAFVSARRACASRCPRVGWDAGREGGGPPWGHQGQRGKGDMRGYSMGKEEQSRGREQGWAQGERRPSRD